MSPRASIPTVGIDPGCSSPHGAPVVRAAPNSQRLQHSRRIPRCRLSRRRRWRNSVELTRRPPTRSFTLRARIHNWVRCSDIPLSRGKAVRAETTSPWSERLIAAMALRLLGHIELSAHPSNGAFDHADIHPPTDRIYVAHTSNDSIDVIDCAPDRYIESTSRVIWPRLLQSFGGRKALGLIPTRKSGSN